MHFFFKKQKINFEKKNNKSFRDFTKMKSCVFKLGNIQVLKGFVKKKTKFLLQSGMTWYIKSWIICYVQLLPKTANQFKKLVHLNKKFLRLKYWRSFYFFHDSFYFFFIGFFKYRIEKLYYLPKFSNIFFPLFIKKKYKYLLSSH